MKSRADFCLLKAHECARAAARVADPQIQNRYLNMSRQWHRLAEWQREIDEKLANPLNSCRLAAKAISASK
jgi:hypothetical protein